MTHQHLNLQLPSSPMPQASSSGPTTPADPQPQPDATDQPAKTGRDATRTRTAAMRQSARIANIGANTEDTAAAQGSSSKVTPLPGAPAKAAAKPAAKPSAKQAAPKQAAPATAPPAPSPQSPPTAAPAQQTADIAALLTWIAQLEQEQAARNTQPIEPPPKAANPTLFTSPEEVEKARAAIIAAKKDEPKVSLPDVVPGFKVNPLDTGESRPPHHKLFRGFEPHAPRVSDQCLGSHPFNPRHSNTAACLSALGINTELKASATVPPKVNEAFKAFKYVLYSTLTSSAWWQAIRSSKEAFTISASGSLMAKGLDRRNERSITLSDWIGATDVAEDRTEHYHVIACVKALKAHHSMVLGLSCSHSWDIAVEYDIQQCKMVAQHPQHDLSQLDDRALTIIATRIVTRQPAVTASYGSSAFGAEEQTTYQGDCTAESTVTGHPTAHIASSAKSAHALTAPGGKIFCISWARFSSCHFANACINYHGCSICGDTAHGAGTCRATRARS
ncbi:uncharacterized protein EDB91DRAFT_1086889 [Suillus paluster]|uniref:uncharacterized protein n=1 Tax=Suillus paluster TaxID=48578 RepID=UPI001B86BF64|nr:uncharacterized protein EDB91DRAFT_1086889 [Suillus paluster]KAG1726068.1 hypothetical protein EDB91DRAFT_1086889 [Suillus paluster]